MTMNNAAGLADRLPGNGYQAPTGFFITIPSD
jgi:hypothetical protein